LSLRQGNLDFWGEMRELINRSAGVIVGAALTSTLDFVFRPNEPLFGVATDADHRVAGAKGEKRNDNQNDFHDP
jgi:hypothetical protein